MDNLLYYFGAGVLGIIIGYNLKQSKYSNHKLNLIIKKLHNMPTKAEFDALRDEFTGALTNIADDITRLTDSLQNGGMTTDEETQAFADLRAIADRANEIAGRTPETPTEP